MAINIPAILLTLNLSSTVRQDMAMFLTVESSD